MGTSFEDLRVLQDAEGVADGIWRQVVEWEPFAREVVGGQLVRAADSVGANIAEGFGRFHYGEKLQFLYYARGSLFETKYWLNRALKRQLMVPEQVQDYATQLTGLARQLNAFASSLKAQRQGGSKKTNSVRETSVEYAIDVSDDLPLFTEEELEWLQYSKDTPNHIVSNLQSPISSL
jgi:four helix bundle protein